MRTRRRREASRMRTRKFFWPALSALTALFVLSAAGLAMASSVDSAVVDTTAPTGSVDLSPGQSAAIQINLSVTGRQGGTATFEVNRDWSLSGGTFTGSNPQTFTVLPRAAQDPPTTFSTSGTVNVASGQATGTFDLSVIAFNITNTATPNLAGGTAGTYSVDVAPPSDSTPPVITPNVSGTLGNNGWYTSNVTVSWSVTDAQSAITSSSGCDTTTVSSDTAGTTLTCTATSAGGTDSNSVTVKRDATAPSFTATPSPAANTNGYNNSPVDVTYSCSDAPSGLADPCPTTYSATTDGTHVFSHTIYDKAGNSASASTTVNLDSAKPSISGSASPSANAYGWNKTDVTVTFLCSDTGTGASGLASCVADGTSPASNSTTLSSEGTNQSVSGTATDNADNTNTATVSGINIDKTPPLISYDSRTPANGNGWNGGNVTVTWSCSDGGSGVVASTVTQTLTEDGANQSSTGTCEDKAGNEASDTQYGINIDTTVPVITFHDQSPEANGAGWNNSDVTVTWDCTDNVSDLLHNAVTQTVSDEGADQSATGTCEDLAGNTAEDTVTGINLDKTAPGVAYTSASPAANAAGWNNSDVTAMFTATDNLSGFAGPSLTATGTASTSGEGSTLSVDSPAFTDLAGNIAAAGTATSPAFKVDKTHPGIAFAGQAPAANANGWNNTDVTLSWNCSDALSGPQAATVSETISTEGTNKSATGTCSDKADNTMPDTQNGVDIDKTKPTLNPTVSPNPVLLNGVATASANAADSLSGLATSSCGAVDTSSLGSHSVSCSATDNAGNSNSASASYSVGAAFSGFLSPLNGTSTVVNVGNAGRAYPIKYQLTDANGAYITNAVTGTTINVVKVACSNLNGDATDAIDYTAATGGTALRYDSTANQYIYNWATPSQKGACYRMTVTPPDGQLHIALFQMK